jgi:hypothetical protein
VAETLAGTGGGPSTSNTSTILSAGNCVRNCCASAANSLSISSTLASPWRSMKTMDSASSRMLSAFSTAPAMGTPKCASTIAGVLGSMAETVSFLPTPGLAGHWPGGACGDRSGPSPGAMRHARWRALAIDGGGARDEIDGGEGRVIGGVAAEAGVEICHVCLLTAGMRARPVHFLSAACYFLRVALKRTCALSSRRQG